MRIDLNANLVGAAENARRPQKPGSRSPSPSSGKGGAPDRVRMRSLESRVNGMPEVRQEQVEALGKAVRKCTYEPPPEKTAEAMMALMTAGQALR